MYSIQHYVIISQWLGTSPWFSPVSSTNKSGRHHIIEILLKVMLNMKWIRFGFDVACHIWQLHTIFVFFLIICLTPESAILCWSICTKESEQYNDMYVRGINFGCSYLDFRTVSTGWYFLFVIFYFWYLRIYILNLSWLDLHLCQIDHSCNLQLHFNNWHLKLFLFNIGYCILWRVIYEFNYKSTAYFKV